MYVGLPIPSSKIVVMMELGGIEKAVLRMIGHWLDGSHWVHCLAHVQADVSTFYLWQQFTKRKCTLEFLTPMHNVACQKNCVGYQAVFVWNQKCMIHVLGLD